MALVYGCTGTSCCCQYLWSLSELGPLLGIFFFFFCNNNTITLSTEGQHFCFFKTVGLHSINSTWILVPMPGPHVCLTSLVHLKLWSRSGRRLPGMPSIISSSHHQDAPSLPHACTCRVVHIEIELVKTVWQRTELKRSVKCPV